MAHLTNGRSTTPRMTVDGLLSLLDTHVPYEDFSVNHADLEQSALQLLQRVFPDWFVDSLPNTTAPPPHLVLAQCKDGITNKLIKCKNLDTRQIVLIRAYGKKSELIIDRQAELITFVALQEHGLAPPLYCRFNNGFVHGYIKGTPVIPANLADPKVYPLIARKLAQWHRVESVPGDRSPRLFKTLWRWLNNVPAEYTRPELQKAFARHINLPHLRAELEWLEVAAKQLNCPIVFCHNDLLAANIIIEPTEQDVSFIDYEYGSFNYRSFDIANHFCEFAGFDCNYARYPSREQQVAWIREYLSAWDRDTRDGDCDSNCRGDHAEEQMLHEIAIFTLAAHFFWGLWGLAQAQHSDIPFDYMGYACLRFAEYERRKSILARPLV